MILEQHRSAQRYHRRGCPCPRCRPESPADFPTTIDRAVLGVALLGVFFVIVTLLRILAPHVLVAIGAH